MQAPPSHPLSLLVVTPEAELRSLFVDLLTEEGYHVQVAASLAEALQRVDEQAFALALADLFVGASLHAFTDAHVLRRRLHPAPMALMMTHPFTPVAAHSAGFAFALPMPFKLEECLSQIVSALNHPLSPAQQTQAQIARRYFAAILARDWEGALALCTDDLAFYPLRIPVTRPARRLIGKATTLAYFQKAAGRYRLVYIASLLFYPSPKGLIACWTGHWTLPDGRRLHRVCTTYFRFQGERISQLGIGTTLPGPPAWQTQPHLR